MMDEINKRGNPAEQSNKRMQELETARAAKQLNDAMNDLSKDSKDEATKKDLFKAMREMTKQVKLNEAKQIDAITSAAIQTALDISMQMKTLDDPRLRRQAMITLRTINDSIKMSEDSSSNNVDDKAVKRNLTVAIDDLKTDSLISRIAEKMSNSSSKVDNAIDSTGPIFGLMKDAIKSVASKIKANEKPRPEVSFLDHQIKRDEKPQPVKPLEVESKPSQQLPSPGVEITPKIDAQPVIKVDFKDLTSNIIAVKDADESILEHIKDISAVMKEQLILQLHERRKENAEDIGKNFRKFKTKPNPVTTQQPTVQKQEDTSGGLLDFITPLLFGGKGLLKVLVSFIGRVGSKILTMLSPKNLMRFAEGVIVSITEFGKNVFGKITGIFDEMGGMLGKFSNLGKLTKGIPIIGQVIAVVMGVFDFFSSFMNADEVLGKSKEAITLWDKVSAGIGGFIGGIVGIADAILSVFGIDTDFGGFIKETVAKFLSDIPNLITERIMMFVDFGHTVVEGFKAAVDKVQAGVEIISEFFNDVTDFISNLGPTLKKMFSEKAKEILNALPGNLGDKLFPSVDGEPPKDEKAKPDQDKPKQEQPEKPGLIQRALSNLPSLSDIFGGKEEKEKSEKEAVKQQANINAKSNVNNVSNVSSTSNNIYQSQPISTRPADDSFRILI